MSETRPLAQDVVHNPDQLCGWKQIGAYLGRGARAVQRWEQRLGLPVHRLRTAHGVAIYASRQELDEWRRRSTVGPSHRRMSDLEASHESVSGQTTRPVVIANLGLACLALVGRRFGSGVPVDTEMALTLSSNGERVDIRISIRDDVGGDRSAVVTWSAAGDGGAEHPRATGRCRTTSDDVRD